jgi:TATA-box binding protein (TBP) (component of TFIID and TFIIIB)
MIEEETCAATKPTINNIKLRVVVNPAAIWKLEEGIKKVCLLSGEAKNVKNKPVFKKHHNFIVFRNGYVCIVFAKSGVVNITGISAPSLISHAVLQFCSDFCLRRKDVGVATVDNTTASGSFNRHIDLRRLKKLVNSGVDKPSLITSAAFNTNYFPACFCKSYERLGTSIIFSSGKYNIVGGKSRSNIRAVFLATLALVQKL